MKEYLLYGYCISHVFLIMYIFYFTKRKFSVAVTYLILTIATVLLIGLEICRYCFNEDRSVSVIVFLLQILIVQGSAVIVSKYRDARALFTGLTATNYVLAGSAAGGIVLILSGKMFPSLIVCACIHTIILICAVKYLRIAYLMLQTVKSKSWLWICILPVLFYMSVFMNASWPVSLFYNQSNIPSTLLFITAMFASYAIMIRLFHLRQYESGINRSNEILMSYSKVLEHEQKHVEEIKKEIAIERHDYQHHLRILSALSEDNDIEGIRKALGDMLSRSEKINLQQIYCESVPINSVLTYFEKVAESEKINMNISIMGVKKLDISHIELASVMSNLLDNAVRACGELPQKDKWLNVMAKYAGGQIVIEVSNPCDPKDIIFDEETGLPLSQRGEGHGIGTQSVLAFARRNRAEFDCCVKDRIFYARLLI